MKEKRKDLSKRLNERVMIYITVYPIIMHAQIYIKNLYLS